MSRKIHLSTEETYLLAEYMESVGNSKLTRRLLAISLRHFGYPIKSIAGILKVSERSVSSWIKIFIRGGFDELLQLHYPTDRDSRLTPYQEAIRHFRQDQPEASLADLQEWLQTEHGVEVEYSWLFRYLTLHQL